MPSSSRPSFHGPDGHAGGVEQLALGKRIARDRREGDERHAVQDLDQARGVHAFDHAVRVPLHGGGELLGRQRIGVEVSHLALTKSVTVRADMSPRHDVCLVGGTCARQGAARVISCSFDT